MTDKLSADWLHAAPARRVMAALRADDGAPAARYVGGCVRNALLGAPVDDIDIATRWTPDEVLARAKAADLGAVPTGLKHGTVTLIADHHPFEVTTLRVDVATDGRRADVAFTEDWKADAARRDFTVNALYADEDGTIYDPVNGLADLKARRIRFIGQPADRIKEDYLRILRFFRFIAWYGKGTIDEAGLAACEAERTGLAQLSVERIWKELCKLFAAEAPIPAVEAMEKSGVLKAILPEAQALVQIRRLMKVEEQVGLEPRALTRLAALLPKDRDCAQSIARRLKLSNEEKVDLTTLAARQGGSEPWSDREIDLALYRFGREGAIAQAALLAAESAQEGWMPVIQRAIERPIPSFSIKGQDLIDLGLSPGPAIGAALAELEAHWIENGLKMSADELKARAAELVSKHA